MKAFEASWNLYRGHMLEIIMDLHPGLSCVHQRCLNFSKDYHSLDRIAVCAPRGATKSVTKTLEGRIFHNSSRTAAIKPAGMVFSVESETMIYDDFVLLIDQDLFRNTAANAGFSFSEVEELLAVISIVPRTQWLEGLLNQIFLKSVITRKITEKETHVLADLLIKELLECLSGSKETKREEDLNKSAAPFHKIIENLETKLLTKSSIQQTAIECGMSVSTLNRLFLKNLGISPQQYVVRRKMEIAEELLKDSTRTVSEAAFLAGYESVSSFSKAFKKYTMAKSNINV